MVPTDGRADVRSGDYQNFSDGWTTNLFTYGAPLALYEYYLNTKKWLLNTVWAQGTHTFFVCNRLLFFYGKCIWFTVCLSHSDILEDLTETETVIKKSPTPRVRQSHFSPENRIAPLSSFGQLVRKWNHSFFIDANAPAWKWQNGRYFIKLWTNSVIEWWNSYWTRFRAKYQLFAEALLMTRRWPSRRQHL